jgi:hypothetical protein
MAKAKSKNIYYIPGLHGDLEVVIATQRPFYKAMGEKPVKGVTVKGFYLESESRIFLAAELGGHDKAAVLTHEIHHSVVAGSKHLDEETACDVVGAYYRRLWTNQDFLDLMKKLDSNVK